jgi:hypothetical protein
MCTVIDTDNGDHYHALEFFAVAGSDGIVRYSGVRLKICCSETFTPRLNQHEELSERSFPEVERGHGFLTPER